MLQEKDNIKTMENIEKQKKSVQSKSLQYGKKFFLILFFSVFALATYGQNVEIDVDTSVAEDYTVLSGNEKEIHQITIEKAVEMALENNLTLKAEKYSVISKKRSNDTKWNVFIPDLNIGTSLALPNEDLSFGSTGKHWNWGWQFSAQLAISASLFNGVKYVKQNYEAALISYEQASSSLERDVKKGFYSILVLEENIRLIENNIETAEKSFRQADINYRNGLVSELDKLQAQVTLEILRPTKTEVINNYNSALYSFKEIIGFDVEDNIALHGEIDPNIQKTNADKIVFSSLADRLDIQLLIKQLKIMDINISAEKNSRIPSLILGFDHRMGFDDPFDKNPFANDDWKDSGGFSAAISFDIDSVIPFLSKYTEIKNLQDDKKAAEANLAQALRLSDIEIRTIIMSMNKSLKNLESLEYSEKLALRSYELASEGYNAGAVELLSLESTINQLQEARLQIVQEKYNYQAAVLDLEYTINKTIEEAMK